MLHVLGAIAIGLGILGCLTLSVTASLFCGRAAAIRDDMGH